MSLRNILTLLLPLVSALLGFKLAIDELHHNPHISIALFGANALIIIGFALLVLEERRAGNNKTKL